MAVEQPIMKPTPRDKWLETGRIRLHYRDWGGSGRPLVLLHGLASTCRIWDLVAPILSEDFAVVALDQRGHGWSDKPESGYDFATLVDDLRDSFRCLGLQEPLIIGHSWGADVALEYVVKYPGEVKGLCFVDGGTIEIAGVPGMTLDNAKREMAPPDFGGVTKDELIKRARSWNLALTPTSQLEDVLVAGFEVLADNTVRARLSRQNHMRIIEALWDHHPSRLYPHVPCPVLLMPARQHGKESEASWRARREKSIALAERLLRTRKIVRLEDSVHDVPLQRPELVAWTIKDHVKGGFFD